MDCLFNKLAPKSTNEKFILKPTSKVTATIISIDIHKWVSKIV